jgi:hypothetical protein
MIHLREDTVFTKFNLFKHYMYKERGFKNYFCSFRIRKITGNEVLCDTPAHRKIKKFVFKISLHNIHIQRDPIVFQEKFCCMSYILALMDLMMVIKLTETCSPNELT